MASTVVSFKHVLLVTVRVTWHFDCHIRCTKGKYCAAAVVCIFYAPTWNNVGPVWEFQHLNAFKWHKSNSAFYLVVSHESLKELWKNSRFENLRTGFLLRCQNSLRQTTPEIILMQHWHCPATDSAEFWISRKQPTFLSSFSRLQVIQNKRPLVFGGSICNSWMLFHAWKKKYFNQ